MIIVDINPEVTRAAAQMGFSSYNTDILKVGGVLVSPANSFGFMDGGVDAAYSRMYPLIQKRVQNQIWLEWDGELPVGQAVCVALPESLQHPYMIIAPTMRTPATDLRGSLAPYLAMRAALRLYNSMTFSLPLPPLICPGLGTASGGMDPDIALAQMYAATQPPKLFATWRETKIYEDQLLRLGNF